MHGYELFSRESLALPLRRNEGDDFSEFLYAVFARFKQELDSVNEADELEARLRANRALIDDVCVSVLQIVTHYLAGRVHEAYNLMAEVMKKKIGPSIEPLLSGDRVPTGRYLYRVRKTEEFELKRKDLFHIPFEDRHKVATQRFSLPGLPCLYLGGSLYECWCELNWPKLEELQVAGFWIRDGATVKLLDFGRRPQSLAYEMKHGGAGRPTQDYLWAHLVSWPVVAASAVKVLHHDAPFKPEYIVPQLLLEWVSVNLAIDGLRFFSTRIEKVPDTPHPICNYIFPARNIKATGVCSKLKGIFRMTHPYPWQLIRALGLEVHFAQWAEDWWMDFVEGIKENYNRTEFGIVEGKVNTMAEQIRMENRSHHGDQRLGEVEQ